MTKKFKKCLLMVGRILTSIAIYRYIL